MNSYEISYFSQFGREDFEFSSEDDEKASEFFKEFIALREAERPGTSGTLTRLDYHPPDPRLHRVQLDYIDGVE